MTPAQLFQHCPACGAMDLTCREERRFACAACGQVFFFNTGTGVGGLVQAADGGLMTIRRARDPGAGMRDLPGGFVEPGESADAALVRELREELGLDARDLDYLCSAANRYVYRGVEYPVCDVFYTCHVDDPTAAAAADDAASWELLELDDLRPEEFAFASVRHAIGVFLESRRCEPQ